MARSNKGRRYEEPKLNIKKVIAVILAVIVFIMSIFVVKGIFDRSKEEGRITSKSYFAVFKDNKWGVIDETGSYVIDPSYAEMIVVPNSKNDVFLCTYDVDYTTGTYKTKALNSKNEEIFTNYEQIEAIQNIDKNNNLWYEENVLRVKKDGKYGTINLDGKELLKCEYDQIIAQPEVKNSLKISKEGKVGIADSEGKIIIEPKYKDVENLGKENKEGFIVKDENEKFGIVDFSNNQILEAKYDGISKVYGNDLYVVMQGKDQVLVKKDGTVVLEKGFDEITEVLKNAENGVVYKSSNKYGIMKQNGETTINAEYDDLKEAKTGILIAKKNGNYGIIDLGNNTKVEFRYSSITYNEKADIYIAQDQEYNDEILNSNYEVKQTGILIDLNEEKGYLALRQNDEYKYYNFKFEERKESDIFNTTTLFLSKKDGKYGYVDKDGNVVVDYKYDDAGSQNIYGYSAVKKDGKWGAINSKGEVVQEPTYNLDEYLKIDFVGRWHLGKDLNMNYYNQL